MIISLPPAIKSRLNQYWLGGLAVGVTGFEPMTSPTRTERATNLRHTPSCPGIIVQVVHFASVMSILNRPAFCRTSGTGRNAEAKINVAEIRIVHTPRRGPGANGWTEPGATAYGSLAFNLRIVTAITWQDGVRPEEACGPLGDIANHLGDAKRAIAKRAETSNRRRPTQSSSAAVAAPGVEGISPGIKPALHPTGSGCPLCLRGQPVRPACFRRQPTAVGLRLKPGHANHGQSLIGRPLGVSPMIGLGPACSLQPLPASGRPVSWIRIGQIGQEQPVLGHGSRVSGDEKTLQAD